MLSLGVYIITVTTSMLLYISAFTVLKDCKHCQSFNCVLYVLFKPLKGYLLCYLTPVTFTTLLYIYIVLWVCLWGVTTSATNTYLYLCFSSPGGLLASVQNTRELSVTFIGCSCIYLPQYCPPSLWCSGHLYLCYHNIVIRLVWLVYSSPQLEMLRHHLGDSDTTLTPEQLDNLGRSRLLERPLFVQLLASELRQPMVLADVGQYLEKYLVSIRHYNSCVPHSPYFDYKWVWNFIIWYGFIVGMSLCHKNNILACIALFAIMVKLF